MRGKAKLKPAPDTGGGPCTPNRPAAANPITDACRRSALYNPWPRSNPLRDLVLKKRFWISGEGIMVI